MSTKRKPLLSDIRDISEDESEFPSHWRDGYRFAENLYEAARAKDAALIQRLVDALDLVKDTMEMYASCQCDGTGCPICRVFDKGDNALFSAAAAGFTPTEP